MPTTTKFGFPKGRVAQTLRKILYPDLTEHEDEAIVVCLMTHLLLEDRINGLIFRSHVQQDAPQPPEGQKPSKTSDAFWEILVKMGFAKKYDRVEPFFAQLFPQEAKIVWKINHLRNTIFHGHAVKEAEFNSNRISDEETVENIFLSGQFAANATRQVRRDDERSVSNCKRLDQKDKRVVRQRRHRAAPTQAHESA